MQALPVEAKGDRPVPLWEWKRDMEEDSRRECQGLSCAGFCLARACVRRREAGRGILAAFPFTDVGAMTFILSTHFVGKG